MRPRRPRMLFTLAAEQKASVAHGFGRRRRARWTPRPMTNAPRPTTSERARRVHGGPCDNRTSQREFQHASRFSKTGQFWPADSASCRKPRAFLASTAELGRFFANPGCHGWPAGILPWWMT